ncbi:preprotein translocase subunit TatC [Halovenus sp. WSH3]|uniref:Sec-independent protein translocase protein TatC n=1 Tax=Halovenus carboxidivorans TaxID=2692199 RepID=A0A6B0SWT8_9EURY|nr:twin-arginine translocase subunit TatC [Halovenus carboxidivorans]MXR50158.1 preprotein translocase subunit TatC [Halovenus carboxidivorans]
MSGALDEDTAKTLASGRQTIGAMLSAAQQNLKRAFVVFLIFWLGSFYALRLFIWDRLRRDLVYNRMTPEVREATEIVTTNPFEVILLQVKIGVAVGIVGTVPVLLYYSRDSLKRRGYWPDSYIPRWKIWGFIVAVILLFLGGVAYAYLLFFPIMFNFLAANAVQSGFTPTWSIAKWTEFIFFLALSFGIAAQLPLLMSSLARLNIVGYETFRDKWRYAVVAIFVFGAVFSPPDPFTQIMWGVPLVSLYFISLGITKVAVLSKQAGEQVSTTAIARKRVNVLAGVFLVAFAAMYAYLLEGGLSATNSLLETVGSAYRFPTAGDLGVLGGPPVATAVGVGVFVGLIAVGIALFYYRIVELERLTTEEERQAALAGELGEADEEEEESTPDPGDPATVNIGAASAGALRQIPLEEFARLDQEQVLEYAQAAADDDDAEKARVIMDRFEAAQELDLDDEPDDVVTSTTTGMLDAFTGEDTDEDDIGGYYYDLAFILDSLTSKAIWIVAVFMTVLAGTFMFLFYGGIERVQGVFFRNIPDELFQEVEIVVLHPVEALIFMIKFSTLLAAVSILPVVLYFAWPAIEDRFGTEGDRNILLVWGGTLFAALIGGSALGFVYIAPTVISILALDVISSNMIIAYRINSFGWLVIYLTVGIGFLTMIPVTMILFHHGNIVPYRRMRESWRGVVLAFFAAAGFLSPSGIFTMFIVAIPASLAYGFGLGLLWIYDGVDRRISATRRGESEAAD